MSQDRMKVVVIGSSGRLGSSLAEFLRADHEVTAIGRGQLDLASSRSIEEVLEPLNYDRLFITGALTGVDYCETHEAEAFAVNAEGPGKIAEISSSKGAHVTYVSTDMVFDGAQVEPYAETDSANPISVYGASKLAGEVRVLAASAKNLVVRVSWVYGPGRPAFPEWIIDKACVEKDLTLPGNKICSPTYTLDLVRWMVALAFVPPRETAQGVFHLCNSGSCTWREWGQFCLTAARDAGIPVIAGEIVGIPVDSVAAFVAKRPVNSAMSTGKFTTTTGITPRDWTVALREHVIHCDSFKKYNAEPQSR